MSFSNRPLAVLLFSLILISSFSFAGLRWPGVRLPGEPVGAPMITTTGVLVATQDGRIQSMDSAHGTVLAPYMLQGNVSVAPLALGGSLIAATDNGYIEAVDGDRMSRKWIYPPLAGSSAGRSVRTISPTGAGVIETNLAVSGGDVPNASEMLDIRALAGDGQTRVYAIDQTRLVALDAQTGRVQFIKPVLEDGGAAGADARHVFVMDGGQLKAFNTAGEPLWALQTGPLFKTRPVADAAHGLVFVASTNGQIQAIDENSGQVNWTYSVNGWPMATPLVVGDRVLIGTDDGRLRGLDTRSGEVDWTVQLGGAVWGEMAGAERGIEHVVLAPTQEPSLAAVDADLGLLRWQYQLSDWPGAPAVSSHSDYAAIATRDRKLSMLDVSPMCTIDSPRNNELIGAYPQIRGRAWAWGGVERVALSVAGNTLDIALGGDGRFNSSPDLSDAREGSLAIQCLAISGDHQTEQDAGGAKSTPTLSLQLQKADMSLTVVDTARPGETLRVFVRNADGFDLDGLTVDFAGKHLEGQASPFELAAPGSDGPYALSVSRRGFNSAGTNVQVQSDQRPLLMVVFVLLLVVLGGAYMMFFRRKELHAPSMPAQERVGKK
ncbi:Outer membrane protein assembly factor BamB [uncultured archaeon]|nr:Outer membrane protein assembly factor BamB [uncultured archaeon]